MGVRFRPHAPFPPAACDEAGVLVVEMGDDVRRASEATVGFRLADGLVCVGARRARLRLARSEAALLGRSCLRSTK